jgi:hypothetical protein
MATVTYYEQSFLVPFWQNVIDWNAELIPVPLGTVSGGLGGFAFENVDGTYTFFLGTDIAVGESAPISGTVPPIEPRRIRHDPRRHHRLIFGHRRLRGVPGRRGGILRERFFRRRHRRYPQSREPRPAGAKPADRDLWR